jgi:hypothetical protein
LLAAIATKSGPSLHGVERTKDLDIINIVKNKNKNVVLTIYSCHWP